MKKIIFLLIRYRIENPDEPRVPCNKQLFEPDQPANRSFSNTFKLNMQKFILEILDWSEVWSIFIPLIVLSMKRNQPAYLNRSLFIYSFITAVFVCGHYLEISTLLSFSPLASNEQLSV